MSIERLQELIEETKKDDSEKPSEDVIPSDEEEKDEDEPVHPMLSMFSTDIHWSPHPFSVDRDKKESTEPPTTYQRVCPLGGPGGLVCCSVCTATYSRYLSLTYQDMQEQRSSKVAEEMEHLLGFVKTAQSRLAQSVRAARKKNPPVNRTRTITVNGNVEIPLPRKPTGSVPLSKS